MRISANKTTEIWFNFKKKIKEINEVKAVFVGLFVSDFFYNMVKIELKKDLFWLNYGGTKNMNMINKDKNERIKKKKIKCVEALSNSCKKIHIGDTVFKRILLKIQDNKQQIGRYSSGRRC